MFFEVGRGVSISLKDEIDLHAKEECASINLRKFKERGFS